jgi:hypothetical protein
MLSTFSEPLSSKTDRTRGIQRHKRHVSASAKHVLIGNNLSFDPVVRHIKLTGGLLRRGLLGIDARASMETAKTVIMLGKMSLISIHGFMTTIIQSRTLDGKKPAGGWLNHVNPVNPEIL